MIARILAELVVLLHFGFVVFVAIGALAVARWHRLAWLHLPAVAWGVLIEYAGWVCPLTPLEVALRERAGQAGYSGGFIEHYVAAWIYPSGLTRTAQVILGTIALAINVAIYGALVTRRRRR